MRVGASRTAQMCADWTLLAADRGRQVQMVADHQELRVLADGGPSARVCHRMHDAHFTDTGRPRQSHFSLGLRPHAVLMLAIHPSTHLRVLWPVCSIAASSSLSALSTLNFMVLFGPGQHFRALSALCVSYLAAWWQIVSRRQTSGRACEGRPYNVCQRTG